MSVKRLISSAVKAVAAGTGLSQKIASGMPAGRVLMYHSICETALPEREFRKHLKGLAAHFDIVSLGEFVQALTQDPAAANGKLVLTFDDGLLNHADTVYPILKEMNLPGTFFICSELLDGGRWLWNQDARARLESMDAGEVEALAKTLDLPTRDSEAVIDHLKRLDLAARNNALEALEKATGSFTPTPQQKRQCELMDAETLKSLDPAVITIGSHTCTHPILPTLTTEQIEREMRDSRTQLEALLERDVHYFCYPNGFNDERCNGISRGIYKASVTTEPGLIAKGADLHRLPRLGADIPWTQLAWRLHKPRA